MKQISKLIGHIILIAQIIERKVKEKIKSKAKILISKNIRNKLELVNP